MDGIHDLGGRHGYGKIEGMHDETLFHAPYEARVRALVHAMSRAPDWNLDWFRHCRELITPTDYLTRPYFDQWTQTYCAMLVNSKWATVEEVSTGVATSKIDNLPKAIDAEKARSHVLKAVRFDSTIDAAPVYKNGDSVRTIKTVTNGHTRLPMYARERRGKIIDHHGAHIFPDDMAINKKRYEHLYTVEFTTTELWPEATESNDTISLDLWESYLESV